MESTAGYRGYSFGTNVPQGHVIVMDNGDGEKRGKRAKPDTNLYEGGTSAPLASRPRKANSTMESHPPLDLCTVKCYNCGQLGHVSLSCTKPPKEPEISLSEKA